MVVPFRFLAVGRGREGARGRREREERRREGGERGQEEGERGREGGERGRGLAEGGERVARGGREGGDRGREGGERGREGGFKRGALGGPNEASPFVSRIWFLPWNCFPQVFWVAYFAKSPILADSAPATVGTRLYPSNSPFIVHFFHLSTSYRNIDTHPPTIESLFLFRWCYFMANLRCPAFFFGWLVSPLIASCLPTSWWLNHTKLYLNHNSSWLNDNFSYTLR